MAYLVYGVVKEPAVVGASMTGAKGRPVFFVAGHGLCAAVSELDVEEGAPPVSELLVYSRVVEDLHRVQAVVPMRYGCFLNGMKAIRNALKERRRQYETLLVQLAGHVEMGIRILLPGKEWRPRYEEAMKGRDALSSAGTTAQPKDEPSVDGRAYLALRKVHYQMHDETLQGRQALIDRFLQAFSGLYARHRTETETKNGAVILSLYFLTPESKVNRFREAFERVAENGDAKALLSGPWPPYNFVTPDLGNYGDTIPNSANSGHVPIVK
ncbi:MAG: GvpL/GvpF family gas vesicle protein [Proteobacteria bacterium]|nr:GvpL/GvpF family gas vesicle protein [Pseudomonadota bacterium]